ncbi:amidohydrolase family protein [Pseudoalteromonas luteoviolacea]|uniref:amidohydrolase family protein n=1 Tax=Pseudoalteromonas luteoviolacea TaxID=43657 RepID=UPI001B361162|nr:amidohydrolase family protein [Pseudoalteromonas luteoviolacea]MBQ4809908.1 amidohydrolase family protein [Pseudoalteromonas luteoviolacea]
MKKYAQILSLLAANLAHAKVDLLIDNATIISPINQSEVSIKTNHWVSISDGKIIEVSNNLTRPIANTMIDANGLFLIPGLTDSHTHLRTMPGLLKTDNDGKRMQSQFLKRQGANYLYYGVTQVIDPANTTQGIAEFKGQSFSPDAYFCGAMPIYQGYAARGIKYQNLHKHRVYYVHQHDDPSHLSTPAITSLHQAKTAVRRLKKDGAICAKIFIEDGFDKAKNIRLINQESVKEITAEANRLKLPVMVHANATDMQSIALQNDIDILAHGIWNWLDEHQQETSLSASLPINVKRVANQILKKNTYYQPSLNVMRSLTDVMVPDHLNKNEYKTVLPNWQLDWYKSPNGQWFAKEMLSGWDAKSHQQKIEYMQSKQTNGKRVLNYLYKKGAPILLGSDTPPAPTYASQPGLSTFWELRDMHHAGVDLVGLLASATINNAKAYQLESKYGAVLPGKVANLLLLRSNPLTSVEAYNEIKSVILHGTVHERTTFHIKNL